MTITLQPITADNWVECIGLSPTEDQQERGFVASNTLSLAQAYCEPWWVPQTIYADQTMVGFLLHGRWPAQGVPVHHGHVEPGTDYILRFMIDGRYQGRGYGRAALNLLIDQLRADPRTGVIDVDCDRENAVATQLYQGRGFQPTGSMDQKTGEVRFRLLVRTPAAHGGS
jgi:diamine N-acetyltransferase